MLPDFNRLRVFYYVFSTGSIVGAAQELNITQSAVSQHIQKLESELSAQLFTRLHRRLAPTLAGERLFGIVKPFVEDLKEGLRTIDQARVKPSGLLRIGSPVEFGKEYFPRIFASYREKYPEVVFYLKLGSPGATLSMMTRGELDFALIDVFLSREQYPGDLGIFSVEPLVGEEVIMTCSREYYDREIAGDHSLANLEKKNYISYENQAYVLKYWFRHHFRKVSLNLNVVMTVESHQAVKCGIKNGLGLGVVASHLVWDEIQRGEIVPITTRNMEIINRISIVQLQSKKPSLTEKSFLAHIKEEIDLSEILGKCLKIIG